VWARSRCPLCAAAVAQVPGVYDQRRSNASDGHRANAVVFSVINGLILRPLNVLNLKPLFPSAHRKKTQSIVS